MGGREGVHGRRRRVKAEEEGGGVWRAGPINGTDPIKIESSI